MPPRTPAVVRSVRPMSALIVGRAAADLDGGCRSEPRERARLVARGGQRRARRWSACRKTSPTSAPIGITGWPSPRRFPSRARGRVGAGRRRARSSAPCRRSRARQGPGCCSAASRSSGGARRTSATRPSCSPDGDGGRRLSEDSPLRRRRPGRQALPRVGDDRAGRRARRRRDALGRARPHHLLRPALPGALPRARRARRAPAGRAVGVHARDRQGPLARAAARAGHREPGLRLRAGAVRAPRRQPAAATATPWSSIPGARCSPSAATTTASRSPASTSTTRTRSAPPSPSSPTAGCSRPRPLARSWRAVGAAATATSAERTADEAGHDEQRDHVGDVDSGRRPAS